MNKLIPLLLLSLTVIACSDKDADKKSQNDQAVSMETQPASTAAVLSEDAVPDHPAEKIAAHTWVIHGPTELPNPENRGFMNNPGFVLTQDGIVVIDPGSSRQVGEMVLRQIKKVSNKPVIAVFNTHVHGDHWLGNDAIHAAYPDAKIYGHKNMLAMIEQGAGEQWIDTMNRLTEGATDGTKIVPPDNIAGAYDTIIIGGNHFDIIHLGKAHTSTDIMIKHEEDNVLYTGDNAGNLRILRVDHGSFKGNADTLQAGIDLRPKHVVPGHGKTGGIEVLENYQSYLTILYDTVAELYEEDLSDFEMKPQVREALAEFHSWSGFEHELGKHISDAYLEIEAADF